MNFSMALAANRIRGTQLDLQALTPSEDPQAVWNQLAQRTLGGIRFRQNPLGRDEKFGGFGQRRRSQSGRFPKTTLMAALLLGSPDFQRR